VLSRVVLGGLWIALGAGQLVEPTGLAHALATHLAVTDRVARALAWGVVAVEFALGLGLVASRRVRWLRPLGPISLVISTALLALVVLVEDLRACPCFGALGLADYTHKLAVFGVLLYLSALVSFPAPDPIPSGRKGLT